MEYMQNVSAATMRQRMVNVNIPQRNQTYTKTVIDSNLILQSTNFSTSGPIVWENKIPIVAPLKGQVTGDAVATIRSNDYISPFTITSLAQTQEVLNCSYFQVGTASIRLPFGDYAVRAFNISQFNGNIALSTVSQKEARTVMEKIIRPSVEGESAKKIWLSITEEIIYYYKQYIKSGYRVFYEFVPIPLTGSSVTNNRSIIYPSSDHSVAWHNYPAQMGSTGTGKMLL